MNNLPYQSSYKFEEYTEAELEKLKTQSKLSKIREERQKELELQDKIKSIKKKQEEQIAKYIGDVGMRFLCLSFRTHKQRSRNKCY